MEQEKQQFELEGLRLENESQNRGYPRQSDRSKDIKVNTLCDNYDIDVFLSSYERLADVNKWPGTKWAIRIAPALTGTACEAFTRMPVEEAGDYSKLKHVVLMAYDLTPEAYRIRLRSV